jgi:hypothetical protein
LQVAKAKVEFSEKWLLVVVERHILWSLWCIDFMKKATQEGHELVVLDLSKVRPRSVKKNSRYFLTKIYRKNRIERILKKACRDLKLEVVRPRGYEMKKSFSDVSPHIEYSNSFINGLDSQFFEEIGSRVTSETQLLPELLKNSKSVYDKAFEVTFRVILEKKVSKVVVPGGRTLIPNAVMSAAKKANVTSTVLEQVTSKSTRYHEFPSDFRQEMKFHQDEIDKVWMTGGPNKIQIAQDYLQRKLYGGQMGRNFSLQFNDQMELEVPSDKKLITIFVGSGFEMTPTAENVKSSHLGSQQQKRILQLFTRLALEFGFFVVLRGHPSTPGLEEMYAAEDLEWSKFSEEAGIIHLPSTSQIDSYKLMKQSALNVVYASTVGIDSIVLGANTLVLANTDWAHLVPEICANDEKSIRQRLHDFRRIVRVERIYPYAYYMECGGLQLSNVDISPDDRIFLDGKEVGEPRIPCLQNVIKR